MANIRINDIKAVILKCNSGPLAFLGFHCMRLLNTTIRNTTTMRRSTHLIIVFCYYFAILLGILNFSYDFRTRRAYKNIYVTIYAGLLNVSLYAVIPYIGMTLKLKTRPPGSEELLYKLSVLITFIRIGGALASVIFHWIKRQEYIKLINSYQHFCEQYLQKYHKHKRFIKYIEQNIRIKFLCSLVTDLIVLTGSVQVFRDIFENSNIYILLALALIPSVLNRIMLHYYFTLQNINALLNIINEELEGILKTTTAGDGQCKDMSNYINVLANIVIQLHYYVARINGIYEIQGVCCMLTVYLLNVSLQMAAFPLEIDLVGLYVVKKPMIFALFGSAIAKAIVLMQYDFKYK
ncbi:hypothetical protein FF38_08776 [Lucilia cuprina]|uniref:Gustatory receptor n=1 Tax=Lucilia cuprina TaxID=7375 RepID=A0A0L0CMY1_LUCCU|nr:hypothetical protein FF38_08776 [Lucilia cuprina]